MNGKTGLSVAGKAYVGAVIVLGSTVFADSLARISDGSYGYYWTILAALTFFSGPFSIKVPSVHASISVSETFVFATVLLFGVAPATVIAAVDGFFASLFMRERSLQRAFFNLAQPAISTSLGSLLFFSLADTGPLAYREVNLLSLVVPLLALVSTYFVLNSCLTAVAVYSETGVSPWRFLRSHFSHLSVNYLVSVSLAALVVANAERISFAAVGVIIPILLMSYVTSRTSIARVEDANRHLTELNRLYLSTVETLAMAIDAKDQVTHGHIRRVQAQAVELARELGMEEGRQIKALEAASLLHDLGKLAVPEHILNKPGKLTPAEYEQMKLHASIGADILSAVEFPYPVVPVVRHHHENWDGSGYPDGLSGPEIPLGARILSVVDCYDALTSDRPYRRRLSDAEAVDILLERRGTMYDPTIVDKFLLIRDRLPREQFEGDKQSSIARMLTTQVDGISSVGRLESLTDGVRERSVGGSGSGNVTQLLARWSEAIAPGSICALYLYDGSSDELALTSVSDSEFGFLLGTRIPLGERLAGWVGANQRAIVNSDPALDFGPLLDVHPRPLRSCLAVPVLSGSALSGVLSLYAPELQRFEPQHVRLLELMATDLEPTLSAAGGSLDVASEPTAVLAAAVQSSSIGTVH